MCVPFLLFIVSGVSLLWVAILGLIVIYIYALIGFAALRAFFAPGEYLYCSTLWQCTVTVIRYGLIGDMFDVSIQISVKTTVFYKTFLLTLDCFAGLEGVCTTTFHFLRQKKYAAQT